MVYFIFIIISFMLQIASWDSTITKMHYHFYKNSNEESVLILGDVNGNIRVILIVSKDKGPFYHKPGIDVTHIYYDRLVHVSFYVSYCLNDSIINVSISSGFKLCSEP